MKKEKENNFYLLFHQNQTTKISHHPVYTLCKTLYIVDLIESQLRITVCVY